LLLRRKLHAEDGPLRVVDIRGKPPLAVNPIAAVDRLGFGDGRIGAAHDRLRIFAPDVLLGLGRKGCEQPAVNGAERPRPGGRRTTASEFADHVEQRGEAILIAAEARGLHEPIEPGFVKRLVHVVGETAVALGLPRPLAQGGDEFAGGADNAGERRNVGGRTDATRCNG
jgi:hypothetical protein